VKVARIGVVTNVPKTLTHHAIATALARLNTNQSGTASSAGISMKACHSKPLQHKAGISLRTAYQWLPGFRAGGVAALADRTGVLPHPARTRANRSTSAGCRPAGTSAARIRRIAGLSCAPLSNRLVGS